MTNSYEAPGIEILGQLHELTLIVPIPVGKHLAANSDGLYYGKKLTPLHS